MGAGATLGVFFFLCFASYILWSAAARRRIFPFFFLYARSVTIGRMYGHAIDEAISAMAPMAATLPTP